MPIRVHTPAPEDVREQNLFDNFMNRFLRSESFQDQMIGQQFGKYKSRFVVLPLFGQRRR
jgi:hypothetical protein